MRKRKWTKLVLIIGIPVIFAFAIRGVFGVNSWQGLYSVMSVTFICLLPFGVGALTIFLSNARFVQSRIYRFFMPWVPIMVFFYLTFIFNVEGWACWIMILPIFLLASSVGGFIAGHFKLKQKRKEKSYLSIMVLLPLFISPIEQTIGKIPGQYQAYTFIDIHGSKEKIWSNVTSVREINETQDKGWFTKNMGFPRPIKAELNYEGVGASRKAIFDKGLVFNETVVSYEHQKEMTFSIKANPFDIPSTTMDEHIVVGGKYFDVLNGTYQLEKLSDTTYRLHLFSHFKLTTTFNFYASWWAGRIMKDIQSNILQIVKERSEKE
jgi:hypothetical protein